VTIGFLGGSITDPRPGYNWPEPVIGWFVNRFPGVRLSVENAAIGATGSALAVFRAQWDIIDRHCDLVSSRLKMVLGVTPLAASV